MTVYVDDMRAPYRGMIMCHMIATDLNELHKMADIIGVKRRWYQGPPKTANPHYDICASKRAKAVKHGAVTITQRQLSSMLLVNRQTGEWVDPEEALILARKIINKESI